VPEARSLFDARAAAAISAAVAINGKDGNGPVRIWPTVTWWGWRLQGNDPWFEPRDFLEVKWYKGDRKKTKAPTIYVPTAKCLPALAYLDFFPDQRRLGLGLRTMVSAAILAASPGWCGSNGPGVDGSFSLGDTEGNYDMSEMHLLAIAYQYYAELSPEARDHLITQLLKWGRIHRPNLDDTFTSGYAPNDWDRAGYVSPLGAHKNIGETENHILMIATTRYLTNQLLFQRERDDMYDNRRNSGSDWSSGTSILLSLLRNILRGDFSEYNSKPYQAETRWALLNLCTYAYDHEVRLGARMVLDYVSAHIAVSSNDLRRMVPFRRRNENPYVAHDPSGFMTVGLLESRPGADPNTSYFAMQAGNTRAYETGRPWDWGINDGGTRLAVEVLSDYRLPYPIHDLFVNDLHRRFFQRLHRVPWSDEPGGNRNSDDMEIYAASPSYLITAGGSPSGYAIDPFFGGIVPKPSAVRQQTGVAVTTSFMPTGQGDDATDLIQFSEFAETGLVPMGVLSARNYGVAPDFACGHNLHLPTWVQGTPPEGGFLFVDNSGFLDRPGYYLAIYQQDGLALLEAFDTWLHPGVRFEVFKADVLRRKADLRLRENEEFQYTTWNGNRIRAVIWSKPHVRLSGPFPTAFGAEVVGIAYGYRDPTDQMGDAGNTTEPFLSGTVMNSPAEAVVEITNPFLGTKITLDMSDPWHPRRTSETGEIEEAGSNHEVWLDFDYSGLCEGDVCRPFNTMAAALGAVADGGAIKILPGATGARASIGGGKRLRLVAPIGGVIIGAGNRDRAPISDVGFEGEDAVRKDDIWVEFDFSDTTVGHIAGPFNNLVKAVAAVADNGIIRIVPGVTSDRSTLGNGKRFRLAAPIGGVTIGHRG